MTKEHFNRCVEIYKIACKVLEDDVSAVTWMCSEQHGLGWTDPVSVLETEEGFEVVKNLLGRIEHGVLS